MPITAATNRQTPVTMRLRLTFVTALIKLHMRALRLLFGRVSDSPEDLAAERAESGPLPVWVEISAPSRADNKPRAGSCRGMGMGGNSKR